MWQTFLWASAISVAFAIWNSLSRANAKMEESQRALLVQAKRRPEGDQG
jgi:hypothetical protein